MDKCPKCGNEVQDDAIFCDQCGARLKPVEAPTEAAAEQSVPAAAQAPQGIVCPSCGTVNTPGEMFCDNCGAPLAAPQPEPEAVAAAAEAPPARGGPRTCPHCGATVAEGDEFCYACGAELPKPSVEAAVPAQEAAVVAEPPSAPQPAEAQAAPAPAPGPLKRCPSCGATVGPTDTFCEFCGAALVTLAEAGTTAVAPAPQPAPTAAAPSPAVGTGPRLIVVASGVEIPLPARKEALVGREDPYAGVYPDIDLTPHGGEDAGVSRRHFKLTPSGAQYTIEDLNSTNFTLVNRQRLKPGVPMTISDGDEIRAGNLRLIFRMD